MSHGYANDETYALCATIDNDEALYIACREYVRELLTSVPTMTEQTIGVNLKNRLQAWAFGGGWGWPDAPRQFNDVLRYFSPSQMAAVNEEDLAETVLSSLEAAP